MDLLGAYGSDDETVVETAPVNNVEHLKPKMISAPMSSAPMVYGALPSSQSYLSIYDPKNASKGLKHNPTKQELMAPIVGPEHPSHAASFMPHLGAAAHAQGYIAPTAVAAWAFDEQFHTYNSFGYAVDTKGDVVGDTKKFNASNGDSISTVKPVKRPRPGFVEGGGEMEAEAASTESNEIVNVKTMEKKKKGSDFMSSSVMRAARAEAVREFELGANDNGPWAEYRDDDMELLQTLEMENQAKRTAQDDARTKAKEEYDVNHDLDRRDERKMSHLLPGRHTQDTTALEATSIFHGKKGSELDYQGNSWIKPPKGTRPLSSEGDDVHDSFLPKKLLHRFTGHAKGVNAIRFFPDTGHLLLSASFDGKVKIWDVHNARNVKRTYTGHNEGIRDANFSHDGRHFITASFDRYMRYWDTETGQCISTLTNRKVPYQVKFHPVEHDVFMMAASDNRLWQWDLKTGETVQEYNHHLQPVNSVLFAEDGQRFVSTSDDKKILIWEYGIPVPMKYISDPGMHAIPTTALHPSTQHFTAQSMENEIHVYGARQKFKRIRKKVFKGHMGAGFACQMTFSPNGKYFASGDGEGRLFVWDWKSTKQLRRFRCHDDGPCIDVAWHPLEPSWVATCGWDGVIKLWD